MCAAVVVRAGSCTSRKGFPRCRVAFGFPVLSVGYVHPLDLVSVGKWRGVEMVVICSCVFLKPLLCLFSFIVNASSTDTGDDVCGFVDSLL